jgi:hypothetical protein
MDSIQKAFANTQSQAGSIDSEVAKSTTLNTNLAAQGNVKCGPVSASATAAQTEAKNDSSAMRNSIQNAATVAENTINAHMQEQNSKQDVTVSDSSKEQMEATSEEGSESKIKNINFDSAVNIGSWTLGRMHPSFIVIKKPIFRLSHLDRIEFFDVSDLERILEKYIRKNATKTRERIRQMMMMAMTIEDYASRNIPIGYQDSNDVWHIRGGNYFKILQQANLPLEASDLAYEPFFEKIDGIVIRAFESLETLRGIGTHLTVDEPALGPFTAEKFRNELDLAKTEIDRMKVVINKSQVECEIQTEQKKLYTDVHSIIPELQPTQKADLIWKLLADAKRVADLSILARMGKFMDDDPAVTTKIRF